MADKKRLLLYIAAALAALIGLIMLAVSLSYNLEIQVHGGTQTQILEFGVDTYQEQGATATINGEPAQAEISGHVDETKLGTYYITYRVRHLWLTKAEVREVKVVDTTAPEITLFSRPGYMVLPGQQYEEEGYAAVDLYDGDLTKAVQVTVEAEQVVYTVTDSSGNKATKVRPIIRNDLIAPVITLNGEAQMTITAGSPYTEPGATAVDNIDGDVSSKIEISGSVNIYCAGTYKLTYKVTDAHGNASSAERTVVVEPIKQPPVVQPDGKVIYLTFDDGPGTHTAKLLEILEKYNAKATFFVVNTGYNMDKMLNAIVDGGHSIGMHSVSHDYSKIYASEEAFFNDLYGMQKIIKDKTGVTTTLMRFPGGSSNTVSKFNPGIMTRLTKAVRDQGFQYFDWNVSSGDAGGAKTADDVYNNVINGVSKRKVSVVLQHDIQKFSVEAVEKIIIWGLQNGYSFQALTPNSPTCHHGVKN